jgi:hypothetical protein
LGVGKFGQVLIAVSSDTNGNGRLPLGGFRTANPTIRLPAARIDSRAGNSDPWWIPDDPLLGKFFG